MLTKLLKLALINSIIFLTLPSISSAQDSQPIELLIPGRIEKIGTYFEIRDSEYLNIALKSTEEIKVILESIPRMISLDIEASSGAASTNLTIEGLEPNKTYIKYQDSYKNGAVFISDEKGSYTWNQDLTKPHHIWIQENDSLQIQSDINTEAIFIPDQCSTYGIWDSATSTCILNQDLTENVEIIQDNITLDCNKHQISGNGSGYGIYLFQRKGVTLRNCNINNFAYAIHLHRSDTNSIANNNVSNNFSGIHPSYSNNDSFVNNIISNNYIGIYIVGSNSNNLTNNSVSGSNEGIILVSSSGNIFTDNSISKNYFGISPRSSSNNKIYHNNFIDNNYGAYVYPDSQNNFFDNGYPSGGNYWSNYSGVDLKSGPNQDQPGSDGIIDVPYTFSGGSRDRYPFIQENGWKVPPPPQRWSFAIITDLHVGNGFLDYGGFGWNDDNSGQEPHPSTKELRKTINLINSNRDKYNIAFAVVLGDLTDSAELSELNKAKEILNELEVTWIPLIGNHDIWPYIFFPLLQAPDIDIDNNGPDKFFNGIFNSQYEKLSTVFQNWEKANVPVWNPETIIDHYSYFQNFAFDYNNYHFIGLDFSYREDVPGPIPGVWPAGELYNFSGGTWDWFTNHLQQYLTAHPDGQENIILLAHHPFRKWRYIPLSEMGIVQMGFSDEEQDIMYNFLKDYKDKIWGEFAGHSHDNKYSLFKEIVQVIETGANVGGSLARIVQVYPDGRIDYSKMLGNRIKSTTHSPVDLIITDPDGLIISKQLNQIPGASYFEEDLDGDGSLDDLIEILERKLGNYQIKVISEPAAASIDTYTLEVSTLEDFFGYTPFIIAKDIPISEIPTEPYIFESKEREITQLTYAGDLNGQYSDKINLNANLTDGNNNPLVNKDIVFQIGEQSVLAKTDENGNASANLTLDQIPGKYYLIETNFSGNEDYLPSVDSDSFEILKESIIIDVLDKEGFSFDNVTLDANIRDGDGQILLHNPKEVKFKISDRILGKVVINEQGKAIIDWQVNLIPKELIESYPITVTFIENEYYLSAQDEGEFTLKSAKWLKQDAIKELEKAKTGNKITDKKIDLIIWFINQSLNENLWKDASRIVFFENQKCNNLEEMLKPEELDFNKLKTKCPKLGITVFYYEKLSVELMMLKPKNSAFEQVVEKLIKTDSLLANISLFDAKNTPIKNPKFQKIIEYHIKKSEEELAKAKKELEKNRPDKAIMRLAKSWLHSQSAIKYANLEIKP